MKCKNSYRNKDKFNRYRNAYNARYYARTAEAPNQRQPWSEEEDRRVCLHSITDTELAKDLGRSVKAIQLRRTRLKSSGILEQYVSEGNINH